jgi:hypothetical protein
MEKARQYTFNCYTFRFSLFFQNESVTVKIYAKLQKYVFKLRQKAEISRKSRCWLKLRRKICNTTLQMNAQSRMRTHEIAKKKRGLRTQKNIHGLL